MAQLRLTLTPDEAVEYVQELVEYDDEIERLERQIEAAKEKIKDCKEQLKTATSRRAHLSQQIRAGATDAEEEVIEPATDIPARPFPSAGRKRGRPEDQATA